MNLDIIINTAAYTNVDKAEDEKVKAELINNLAVRNLSQLCKDKNIALIHISTDYIFDGSSEIPYLETDVGNPISFYGKSKLDGELAITNSGCKFVILRTSWVYSEYGSNFVKTIVRLCKDQDKISIIDDQIGCPTYAQDIAKAIINITHFILKDICKWGIYNYCGNTPLTWYQFAQMILKSNETKIFYFKL
jgi:dTDP-4-dehydrorhamnose reductase